jgi:hypothetical protein
MHEKSTLIVESVKKMRILIEELPGEEQNVDAAENVSEGSDMVDTKSKQELLHLIDSGKSMLTKIRSLY